MLTGRKRSTFEIPLTPREKEILKLVAEEHSNQEIAQRLYISLCTVENAPPEPFPEAGGKEYGGAGKGSYQKWAIGLN